MDKVFFLIGFLFTSYFSFGQFNKALANRLDTIYFDDQRCREKIDSVDEKFGWESKEMDSLLRMIDKKDSVNILKVTAMLDTYGWLGAESIGNRGNSTLFLVIQHSKLSTQEKYLPMMREAVKKGNAAAEDLALLEDNVALGKDKLQIYGSQIRRDNETHFFYVAPMIDPDNVDKRRAAVGLEPLAEYVKSWQIIWNVMQYKKDLAKYIAFEKRIIN